jgi:hypothetical protein
LVDEAIEQLTADRSRILARLALTSSASLARWWTLVDEEDAGDILITENLAHPYGCGVHKCPRPKRWCPFQTE